MNEGDPKDREDWVQIITAIPEMSSTDHSRKQSFDKRIIFYLKRFKKNPGNFQPCFPLSTSNFIALKLF